MIFQDSLRILWRFFEDSLKILWRFFEDSLRILWELCLYFWNRCGFLGLRIGRAERHPPSSRDAADADADGRKCLDRRNRRADGAADGSWPAADSICRCLHRWPPKKTNATSCAPWPGAAAPRSAAPATAATTSTASAQHQPTPNDCSITKYQFLFQFEFKRY